MASVDILPTPEGGGLLNLAVQGFLFHRGYSLPLISLFDPVAETRGMGYAFG